MFMTAGISNKYLAGTVLIMTTATVVCSFVQPHLAGEPKQQQSYHTQIRDVVFPGQYLEVFELKEGEDFEVHTGLKQVSSLPPNGRILFEWGPINATPGAPNKVTKVLHALDGDITFLYRIPKSGLYRLRLSALTEGEWQSEKSERRYDIGHAPKSTPLPHNTPWPAGGTTPIQLSVTQIPSISSPGGSHSVVSMKPNGTPEYSQPISITSNSGISTWNVYGSEDELDYFDNGLRPEKSGEWFKLNYTSQMPCLLTAELEIPNRIVSSGISVFRDKGEAIEEYKLGADPNERKHQQMTEKHSSITRKLFPGQSIYLCVDSNSPLYRLQLRTLPIGPYADPKLAIRQGMYNLVAQTDGWLNHRPREADIDRRIRETGNLLGTHCMACHVQAGVFGVSAAVVNGYGIENSIAHRNIMNTMYESLRPTNELVLAGNNTSLPPLDKGDGLAGTRVTGFTISSLERTEIPPKLHAQQVVRAANFVMQTTDPEAINGATTGSFAGKMAVYRFSTETLISAWERTKAANYLPGIKHRVSKAATYKPKILHDLANRVMLFVKIAGNHELLKVGKLDRNVLLRAIRNDCDLIYALQQGDGGWKAELTRPEAIVKPIKIISEPAATALALSAFSAAQIYVREPSIDFGITALLNMQLPGGLWKGKSETGFVATAYALDALSRYFPDRSLPGKVIQVPPLPPLPGAVSRAWETVELGETRLPKDLKTVISRLSDPVKMVREAAISAVRRYLMKDTGWTELIGAIQSQDDTTREAAWQVMRIRFDGVLPYSRLSWVIFNSLVDQAMSKDKSPAVRAWAMRAAWENYVWNSPVRRTVNSTWVHLLGQPEENAFVENNLRYFTHALLSLNGHRGNVSPAQQYETLIPLFAELSKQLHEADNTTQTIMVKRLTAVAATYYGESGADGGPDQMGYGTKGSAVVFTEAISGWLDDAEKRGNMEDIALGIEAASGLPDSRLTNRLNKIASTGLGPLPELAMKSMSTFGSVLLLAVPETIIGNSSGLKSLQDSKSVNLEGIRVIRTWTDARWQLPNDKRRQKLFFETLAGTFSNKVPDAFALAGGEIIANNEELQTATAAQVLFDNVTSSCSAFAIKSVPWVLRSKVTSTNQKVNAFKLYLKNLKFVQSPALFTEALRLAGQFPLSAMPETLLALKGNVNDRGTSVAVARAISLQDLQFKDAIKKHSNRIEKSRMSEIMAFKNFVLPHLEKTNRKDGKSCISCHSASSRVPTMPLASPDRYGFSVAAILSNYRAFRLRVNISHPEKSLFVVKPLNFQDGTSDTHQGGMRFLPADATHGDLVKWANLVAKNGPYLQIKVNSFGRINESVTKDSKVR